MKFKSYSTFSGGCTTSSQHALLNCPAYQTHLPVVAPFSVCVHACTHLFAHMCVSTWEHSVHLWVRRQCWLLVLRHPPHFVWDRISHGPGTLVHRQFSWPASFQGSSCPLHLTVLGLQACTTLYLGSKDLNVGPLVPARDFINGAISPVFAHCNLMRAFQVGHFHTALTLSGNLSLPPSRLQILREHNGGLVRRLSG